MIAVQVNGPSSASLDYNRLKVEKAAELAREIPETKATNSNVNGSGGRVYVDLGRKSERNRSSQDIAQDLRAKLKGVVGAEYIVLDDLNNGAQKPVQIQFYGPDGRRLNADHRRLHEGDGKDPGRGRRGSVRAGTARRAAHRTGSWPCQPARHLGG